MPALLQRPNHPLVAKRRDGELVEIEPRVEGGQVDTFVRQRAQDWQVAAANQGVARKEFMRTK